jgi:hypothetical protein
MRYYRVPNNGKNTDLHVIFHITAPRGDSGLLFAKTNYEKL